MIFPCIIKYIKSFKKSIYKEFTIIKYIIIINSKNGKYFLENY
jgi:hypothetical protein